MIVVISQLPPPTHGSTVMTEVFLKVLAEGRHDVRLVDRRFSHDVQEIGSFSGRKVLAALGLLWRAMRATLNFSPGPVVFFVTNRRFSFLVDCALAAVLRLSRREIIAYVHTSGYKDLAESNVINRAAVRWLLGTATKMVLLSPSLAEDVTPFISRRCELIFIPNAVPDPGEAIEKTPKRVGEPRVVIFLSNLVPEKGVADFLAVAARMGQSGGSTRFMAAGASAEDGDVAALRSRASGNTEILGPVHGEKKSDLFRAADVLLFPSTYRFEAQPLVILEALSFGVPVIAYRVGGLPDVIDSGVNGWLLEKGDTNGLVALLEELFSGDEQLARASHAARETYDRQYSVESFAKRWNDVLRP